MNKLDQLCGKFCVLEMRQMICVECGIFFQMDAQVARVFMRDEREIYCPNGHAGTYRLPEQEDAAKEEVPKEDDVQEIRRENRRLRREITKARHDAEQAEARARDSRREGGQS